MSKSTRSLITIAGLILATTAALTFLTAMGPMDTATPHSAPVTASAGLSLSSEVVQEKIVKNGDGQVSVALSLTAQQLPETGSMPPSAVDLVIVLDRSGSMEGQKLSDACQAVAGLIDQLGPSDRLALVTYADRVQTLSPLTSVTTASRGHLMSLTRQVVSGGGTNLGGGLRRGIDLLLDGSGDKRYRKVILISDGLANQGVTDPAALGGMAALAVERHFSVSTVGVGLDFNETLMTAIADHGTGSYHFLENPLAFARVFQKELMASRQVAVSGLQIRIPLSPGVQLTDAGGYPVRHEKGVAIIHPGDLLSGQQRSIFLTFAAPSDKLGTIPLSHLQMQYVFDGQSHRVDASAPLTVTCVADPAAAMASINKDVWSDQVVKNDFSQLKEAVAKDIREGEKSRAQLRIQEYQAKQTAINQAVGSAKVAENLSSDVQTLRDQVEETFAGPPATIAEKKKQVSKSLQYDSYRLRRDKK